MKAVVLTTTGHPSANFELKDDIEKPKPGPHDVLIKVKAIGMNPVDWKMAQYGVFIESCPIVLGADAAGEVEAVGAEVTRFKPGDEVAAYTPLGVQGCGTFAEFCKCPEDLILHKPERHSFDQACSVPVGLLTAALGLYSALKVPLPSQAAEDAGDQWFLVWGGSSVVGSFAVQLAKASGFKVVATASPRNFDKVTGFGANHVLDYHSATVIDDIKTLCGDKLSLAFDAVGQVDQTMDALSTARPGAVASCAGEPSSKSPPHTFHDVMLGTIYTPERTKDLAALAKHVPELEALLTKGVIKPPHISVSHGLEKVQPGIEQLAGSKVSCKKLVIALS